MKGQKANKIKHVMFSGIIVFLWLPFLQSFTDYFELEPLKGDVETVADVTFDKDNWFSGEYQSGKAKYLKNNFGFRRTMVRVNNQKLYNLYNKTTAKKVIVGKDEYLYEENYIEAYLGNNFIGEKKITHNVTRLKQVKQELSKLGKNIVYIMAPGKASYFPEFIPDKYGEKREDVVTNYEGYLKEFAKQKIDYIDFNQWFRDNKGKTIYPLYAKCGIHWSKYSEMLVADSIIGYIEALKGIELPQLIIDKTELSEENKYEDYDVGNGMNLLFNLSTYPMGYSSFHFEKKETKTPLNAVIVADSYYWGIFNYGIPNNIFNKHQFWYYNNQVYPESYDKPTSVSELNIAEVVRDNDIFIALFTDANMHNFDYGLTDLLYNHFFGLPEEQKHVRVKFYIDKIKNSPDWLEKIKIQAKEQNKTVDEMIKANAEYMVETVG